MTVLLVAESREGWEHASALVEQLSIKVECSVLRDSSLPDIQGIRNLQLKDLLENPAELFSGKNIDDLVVVTQRQGMGPLTRHVLESCERVQALTVIQDYWGDTFDSTLSFQGIVRYIVRDDLALQLTKNKCDADIYLMGCPRYALFEEKDPVTERCFLREELHVEDNQKLIGWFGQSPLVSAAYERTLNRFAEAVSTRPMTKVLYRPHGRESDDQIRLTENTFCRHGVSFITVRHHDLWQWLCAVDAVFSVFSNCCADAIYLNRVSRKPINCSVYLMFDAEMLNYHIEHTHLRYPPLATQGVALTVANNGDLEATLDAALDQSVVEAAWRRTRSAVILGSSAAKAIADLII